MNRCAVIILALAAAVAGCQPKGGRGDHRPSDHDAWWPRPVAVRVYPSTRFVSAHDAQALLEARLELADEMGDPLKAPGEFRLELFSDTTDRQLYAWRVRALTLDEQKMFYDPITRTYLLRLKLDPAALAEASPRLRVTFALAGGGRLQDEAPVRK